MRDSGLPYSGNTWLGLGLGLGLGIGLGLVVGLGLGLGLGGRDAQRPALLRQPTPQP